MLSPTKIKIDVINSRGVENKLVVLGTKIMRASTTVDSFPQVPIPMTIIY